MLQAWVEITDRGVTIGVEHAPACPHLVEQHADQSYCQRSRESVGKGERDVELAFDAATSAIAPWWRRAWTWLGGVPIWTHDGSLHHHFHGDVCVMFIELGIAEEELRLHAAHAAHVYLSEREYTVTDKPLLA
jgi:hypothetical protein